MPEEKTLTIPEAITVIYEVARKVPMVGEEHAKLTELYNNVIAAVTPKPEAAPSNVSDFPKPAEAAE